MKRKRRRQDSKFHIGIELKTKNLDGELRLQRLNFVQKPYGCRSYSGESGVIEAREDPQRNMGLLSDRSAENSVTTYEPVLRHPCMCYMVLRCYMLLMEYEIYVDGKNAASLGSGREWDALPHESKTRSKL